MTDRRTQIVDTARGIVEEEGIEGLSMRRLARAVGMQAPSLYKHLPDKQAVENEVIAAGLREQGDAMLAAIDGADDPLGALAARFRSWALERPNLYRLLTAQALDGGEPVASAEQHAGEAARRTCGGDVVAARIVWTYAHGLLDLELKGRFPSGTDVEEIYRRGIEALRASPSVGPSLAAVPSATGCAA